MYNINKKDSCTLMKTNKTLSTKLHPSPLSPWTQMDNNE
jgi:hypothetical protein